MADEPGQGDDQTFRASRTPLLEWLFAAIGCLIVCGAVGFLIYQMLRENGPEQVIEIRELRRERVPGGFRVDVEVENVGYETAADLQLTAEHARSDQPPETAEVVMDYLPARSTRQAGFFFSGVPHEADVQFQAGGFNQP